MQIQTFSYELKLVLSDFHLGLYEADCKDKCTKKQNKKIRRRFSKTKEISRCQLPFSE